MAGWYHWLNGQESDWTPGVGDGQGVLVCCDSWGCKESDMTEWLNCAELTDRIRTLLIGHLIWESWAPTWSLGSQPFTLNAWQPLASIGLKSTLVSVSHLWTVWNTAWPSAKARPLLFKFLKQNSTHPSFTASGALESDTHAQNNLALIPPSPFFIGVPYPSLSATPWVC